MFACKNTNSVENSKFKVVVLKLSSGQMSKYEKVGNCPSEIPFDVMPGGLILKQYGLTENSKFNQWENARKGIWITEKTPIGYIDKSVVAIHESIGGERVILFCVSGAWNYIAFD